MRSKPQPFATHGNVSACVRAFLDDAICDRLPPVATTGLHKGSIRWLHIHLA
jgi:hypothetical protein